MLSTGTKPNRVRTSTTWCAAVLLAVLLAWGAAPYLIAQKGPDEYEVKGAFLFHFAQFVDWPQTGAGSKGDSIYFCMFDDDQALQEIRKSVDGKKVGSRTYRWRALHTPQDGQGCHVLFLSRSESRRQSVVLKALEGLPILTVGETDDFLSDGGIIRFHLDSGRVRFDIDLATADSSRIKISSRLLLLASYVVRNSPEGFGGR